MKNLHIYILILLLLSSLLIFVLILPKYENLNFLKQEIFAKEAILQSQEEYFQELQKTSEQLQENQASFLKIESALPESRSLAEILNFFQKAASQSGLTLEAISPVLAVREKEEKIVSTKINLILIGSYTSFKDFLSLVEKSARLIEVESIYFSYPEREGPFTFNIAIKIYSY